jgi:transcriptional regulator with XRE-family HTH domain
MKVNIEKIKSLAKEKGISISFICESVGMGRGYLNDIKKSNGGDIPDDRLDIIIGILNTTIDYLTDKTDIKEKPASIDADDELIAECIEALKKLKPNQIKRGIKYLKFLENDEE